MIREENYRGLKLGGKNSVRGWAAQSIEHRHNITFLLKKINGGSINDKPIRHKFINFSVIFFHKEWEARPKSRTDQTGRYSLSVYIHQPETDALLGRFTAPECAPGYG